MSFSNQVKKELAFYPVGPRHCDIAEILGFINNKSHIKYAFNKYYLLLDTDNYFAAKRFWDLISASFKINCHIKVRTSFNILKQYYQIYINQQDALLKIFKSTLLYSHGEVSKGAVKPLVLKNVCCKRSYLRSVFLTNGSISDPAKGYHLEFIFSDRETARQPFNLLTYFDLNPKEIRRNNYHVIYLKESENIADLLNITGAHSSLLELENIRVLKNVGNQINRSVNCEAANMEKTVTASVKQIEDIKYIEAVKGLSFLPGPLREIAALRLDFPDASFKELGDKLTPGISKSGVNHRLRKISLIAKELRSD